MAAPGPYSVDLPLPHHVGRGLDSTVYAPVRRSAALVAPSEGSITIYDATGAVVVSLAAVAIVDDIAQYTVSGATTAGMQIGDGWRVVWRLIVAGVLVEVANDASLVIRPLHPVVSDDTLWGRVPALNPSDRSPISHLTTYQRFIDESWTMIQQRLIDQDRRPYLVVSPGALRETHLQLALSLVYDDLAARLANPEYSVASKLAEERYEKAWNKLALKYAEPTDGQTAGPARRVGQPTIFLTSRR